MTVTATVAAAELEALEARITQSVLERLQTTASPWLNIEQAAEYLAWSKKRLYNLVAAKAIPHRKVGNRLLFHRGELDGWLTAYYEGPPAFRA